MDDFIPGQEGFQVSLYAYWVILTLAVVLCALLMHRYIQKNQYKRHTVPVYLLFAIPLALFFGRLIYSVVRFDRMYLDGMGNFSGVLSFFDPSIGSINAFGVGIGCILAGFAAAWVTKQHAGRILDAALPFGVLLYALERFAQPITGQGFGDLLVSPLLPFYPFGIMNDWGEWMMPVCAMEGLLALLVFAALMGLRSKTVKPGTLALYGLALFSASQIIPQSLRQDDVLMIFIFARVNQIGYMILLCAPLLYTGIRTLRHSMPKKHILIEWTVMFLGVLLAIGCEFALDKTNIPDLMVYAVMVLDIACLCAVTARRIHKEDIA